MTPEDLDKIKEVLGEKYSGDEAIPIMTLVKVISLHDPNWLKAEKE